MGSIVRSNGISHLPLTTRGVGRLSTGVAVTMVFDNNATGLSGAGGDGTGVGKIYIYAGTPNTGGAMTNIVATITTDLVAGDYFVGSMHVDAGDHIHVAWKSTGGNVRYVLLTCTSNSLPTYTVGTLVTVYTFTSNQTPRKIDIDVVGTASGSSAVPVIGVTTSFTSTPKITYNDVWIRRTSDSTWQHPYHVSPFSDSQFAVEEMTLAAIHDTVVSNNGFVAFATNRKTNGGTDYGDLLVNLEININTGALVATTNKALGQGGVANGYRRWQLFTTNTREFTLVGVLAGTKVSLVVYRYTVSTGNVFADVITLQKLATNGVLDTSKYYNWCSVGYFNNNIVVFGTNGNSTFDYIIRLVSNTVIPTAWYKWDNGTVNPGIQQCILSGSNRNFSTTIGGPDTQMTYQYGVYETVWWTRQVLPVVSNIMPSGGSTVASDTPTLSFDQTNSIVQAKVRGSWRISQDASFGTYFTVEFEDPSSYYYVGIINSGKQTITFPAASYPVGIQFPQGLWYIKACEVDEFGVASAFTSGGNFSISHPPVPTSTSPTQGNVLVYSAGGVTMNWRFTSPWPMSAQSAYEITVTDETTGTVIVDTGIVSSVGTTNPQSMSGVVVVPSANKDLPLLWQIAITDEDGITSAYSNGDLFYVSDVPVPVFTNPTAGSTMTNGVPLVAWTPGISSTKTQATYRLMITQGNVILHDSSWQVGTASSWQVPPGLLHTAQSYTFSLYIRDSFGLQGQVIEQVTTSWTPPPAAAAQTAYLYEFIRRGFVYIGWSNAAFTAGFQRYNLYRRAAGETAFTLLESVTDSNLVYGYRDFSCKAQTFYEYFVTQQISSNGDLVETPIGTTIKVTTPVSTYFLLDPLGISDAVPLFGANSDEFTEDYETATYHVIGSGMHTDIGDYLGHSGTLVCNLTDRTITGVHRVNSVINPSMQAQNLDGSPTNWTVTLAGTTGNIGWDNLNHQEPAPNGKFGNAYLFADGLATTTGDYIELTGDAVTGILPCVNVGDTFTASLWIAKIPGAAFVPAIYLGAILSDGTHTSTLLSGILTSSDIYEPSVDTGDSYGSGLFGTGIYGGDIDNVNSQTWARYTYTMTVASPIVSPVTQVQMLIKVRNASGSTAQLDVIYGGAQLEAGSTVQKYFDGDFHGCQWYAGEYISPSTNDGFYSAYEQRTDISNMRALGRPLMLRSSYGDLWQVTPGPLAMTRTPGVGGSDIGPLSIPYQEVGF